MHWLNFAPSKATHADFCVFSTLLFSPVWIVLVSFSLLDFAVPWTGHRLAALSSKLVLVYLTSTLQLPLHSAKTEPKFGRCRIPTALGSPYSDANCGSGKRKCQGVTKIGLPKFTSNVKY